jgi:hypothetical protein
MASGVPDSWERQLAETISSACSASGEAVEQACNVASEQGHIAVLAGLAGDFGQVVEVNQDHFGKALSQDGERDFQQEARADDHRPLGLAGGAGLVGHRGDRLLAGLTVGSPGGGLAFGPLVERN